MPEPTAYEKFLFNGMIAIETSLADDSRTAPSTDIERVRMKTNYATAVLELTDDQLIAYATYRRTNR